MTQRNLIRIGVVAEKLGGVHESHAWRKLSADSKAPKPIRLGSKHTVFDAAQIDTWIDGLIQAAKDKPVKSSLPDAAAIRRGAGTRKARRELVAQ